jgi:hypothetical protein
MKLHCVGYVAQVGGQRKLHCAGYVAQIGGQ